MYQFLTVSQTVSDVIEPRAGFLVVLDGDGTGCYLYCRPRGTSNWIQASSTDFSGSGATQSFYACPGLEFQLQGADSVSAWWRLRLEAAYRGAV